MKWDTKTNTFSNSSMRLDYAKSFSLCWAVDDDGILLLGGTDEPTKTEYVLVDGSASRNGFALAKPVK